MNTSTIQITVLTFPAQEPVRTKTIINDKITNQVNHFNCLGDDIGYDKYHDTDFKLGKFNTICAVRYVCPCTGPMDDN